MHKLLQRQLKKTGVSDFNEIKESQWFSLLEKIDQSYQSFDQDRYTLQRSLDISSQEMRALFTEKTLLLEAREQSILNAMPDLLFVLDEEGLYVDILANQSPELLVQTKSNLLGHYVHQTLPQTLADKVVAKINQAIDTNELQLIEYDLELDNGKYFFEGRIISTGQQVNQKSTVIFLARDISNVVKAQGEQKLLKAVMDKADEGLVVVGKDKKVLYANQSMEQLVGITIDELINQGEGFLRHEKDLALCASICELAHQDEHIQKEIIIHKDKGDPVSILLNLTTLRDDDGDIQYFFGVLSDMSALKKTQEALRYHATHDALTSLPNRIMFEDRFEQSLARSKRANRLGMLLFIDLDNFKSVNDSLGHGAGDELLVNISNRLVQLCRSNDTVARFGGDEFVIVIEDIDDYSKMYAFLDKIICGFDDRVEIQGYELEVTFSIGVSIFPEQGDNIEQLLKQADTAMYAAKKAGKNRYHIFTKDLLESTVAGFTLDLELRKAIEEKEFYLVFQPQYALADNRISGFEALIRWAHPTKGTILPKQFVPAAEVTGLIDQIGLWVFEAVCQQVVTWSKKGLPFSKISFNLSQRQLVDDSLFDKMLLILKKTKALNFIELIECEITESAIFDQLDVAYKNLKQLAECGMSLSIDDFGTGHSSLLNLKRFPLKSLKIDQAFVADVGKDISDEAIIKATIALANSFNLNVVAEGVETQEQEQFLKSIDCTEVQGFLYSHPLTEPEAAALLEKDVKSRN